MTESNRQSGEKEERIIEIEIERLRPFKEHPFQVKDEDSAILDGMQHLRSAEEYRHLAEAAVCRSQADWLVGMNATRAYTTKYFKKLTVAPLVHLTTGAIYARLDHLRKKLRKIL